MGGHYDFIVVGGGSAGFAAARTVAEEKRKVAIVDSAEELGGLCILRGCMPSKTLLYIAEILHHARRAETFGLDIPSARADMAAVHDRKLKIIGEFADYRADQLRSERFDLYRGHARFLGKDSIILDDERELTADAFLLSTGSIINFPPLPGLDAVPVLTSDEVLDLDSLPGSIIVLGGGVVACELTQFLNRMGSEVVQIQRSSKILREATPQSADVLMRVLRDEGVELFTGTTLHSIKDLKPGIRVTFEKAGTPLIREADCLFNALGRKPNTRSLDLEKAGVALLPSGHIETNSLQQTANPKIYAAGDCAGPHEIVHLAIRQGETAAHHFLGRNPAPVNYDLLTKIIFTEPQIAVAGLTERDLEGRAIDYASAEFPFSDHGKSILMEAKYGYVKVLARKPDGRVLGAECVGKDGGELIHSLSVAIALQATASDLLKAHWYHPTLSEIWTYPLEEIVERLKARSRNR